MPSFVTNGLSITSWIFAQILCVAFDGYSMKGKTHVYSLVHSWIDCARIRKIQVA